MKMIVMKHQKSLRMIVMKHQKSLKMSLIWRVIYQVHNAILMMQNQNCELLYAIVHTTCT